MPTLDMRIRLTDKGKVQYRYYEKEVASKYCIMKQAAISDQTKKAVLVQEVVRRMMNTWEGEGQEIRDKVLDEFDIKVERSGNEIRERKEIMRRGLLSYEKIRKMAKEGRRQLHIEGAATEK